MSDNEGDDNVLVRVMNNIVLDDDDDDDDDDTSDDSDDNDFIRIIPRAKMPDDEKENEKSDDVVIDDDDKNIRVGFAYATKSNPSNIYVHEKWQEYSGRDYKTPTVLKYDDSFNVISWGYSAMASSSSSSKNNKKNKKNKNKEQACDFKLAERFKLKLRPNKKTDKIYLPEGLDYKKAIIDYLTKIREVMQNLLEKSRKIDFFKQVLIIMTVPTEFDNRSVTIMRECAFKAGLIKQMTSPRLKFTTEPEAGAINCMSFLKDLNVGVEKTFMLVDCGGGTVDLTTRRLLKDNKLGETIKSRGGDCGGSFVDDNFIEFLASKVGQSAIDLIRKIHYSQLQYAVQEFCRRAKYPFTGQENDFKPFELDLTEYFPDIKQYVKGSERVEMEKEEWNIELKFDDVKKMFDPVIEKIIELISKHLDESNDVSAMLLVGGFSESKYLQELISQKFQDRLQNKIYFPEHPATAIVEGAVKYGLNREVIATRVLKWTYGTDVARKWKSDDPEERKLPGSNQVIEFSQLIECEKEIPINKVVSRIFTPGCIFQRKMGLDIYITEEHDADFCDSPGVKLLGKWSIKLPITLGLRPVLFLLVFGEIEISAIAINLETGRKHKTRFELLEL
ncbi:actin-like ATPase domain-containing protein [Rhizophagus irregularis]|uniref:Actin-like ATPase domain-containing protein n=1 Tax=Rhizophagus irregularis TaxID=588596 RepID=A0A2N1MSL1_9GLOM|nr:actin-like ATPase domain-containing protein [Rhizophagus irregularis]